MNDEPTPKKVKIDPEKLRQTFLALPRDAQDVLLAKWEQRILHHQALAEKHQENVQFTLAKQQTKMASTYAAYIKEFYNVRDTGTADASPESGGSGAAATGDADRA